MISYLIVVIITGLFAKIFCKFIEQDSNGETIEFIICNLVIYYFYFCICSTLGYYLPKTIFTTGLYEEFLKFMYSVIVCTWISEWNHKRFIQLLFISHFYFSFIENIYYVYEYQMGYVAATFRGIGCTVAHLGMFSVQYITFEIYSIMKRNYILMIGWIVGAALHTLYNNNTESYVFISMFIGLSYYMLASIYNGFKDDYIS